ncbi:MULTISPECIES: thiamine phosphate synthase [Methylosinus]|uniref:Thiamine phosphate synthase n=1 Tax=Methylosinus trichosporium (strain ATCC 35070 / NCIMB 11131 / UNIQEM 75 / OB3b) TaxID=595536 RepID=A0A2D2CZ52_METT3|nr:MULTISPECIES: thiamine phosphate synthase [Methylosinus]ATQ68028.1 thiamine phosphate synthase [Methylosinus trichosporium OB3b]OBS53697.1 thiamine phosphate synthase [Methylosinus sp. 3S-1]
MSEPARLYLATPLLTAVDPFLPALREALDAAEVASLLLRLGEGASDEAVRAVAALAQPRDIALLLEGESERVARCGADGLHFSYGDKRLAAELKRLHPDFIVGVGGLETRDDAMRAGEAGADYLLFDGDFDETLERAAWWAEIFETPCVALARRLEEVGPLAATGAEFVMIGEAAWSDPRGPAAALREAAARIAAEDVAR